MEVQSIEEERRLLERAGTLRWFHWAIILLSLLLTLSAWYITKHQVEDKIKLKFDRQAEQAVSLILERMKKYEDALWGGVAFIQAYDKPMDFNAWRRYARSIDIATKYPGINGIGVISAVEKNDLSRYLHWQRQQRPNFKIYPKHKEEIYLPISYIIPVKGNEQAVGLDMAHEINRYTAAQRARDTGQAQITGPIILVQDASRTPGFLFYAPFYEGGHIKKENFKGMVYAPFVVNKLMEGVLAKRNRQVGVSIRDGSDMLYNEHLPGEKDYDPDPLLKKTITTNLYGRHWSIELWTTQSFRQIHRNSQPIIILFSGIAIDVMLLLIFIFISKGSRRALHYADRVRYGLQLERERRSSTSQELEKFTLMVSHDMRDPIKKIEEFSDSLFQDLGHSMSEKSKSYLTRIRGATDHINEFFDDLLNYTRASRPQMAHAPVCLEDIVNAVLNDLEGVIERKEAKVTVEGDWPVVEGWEILLKQLLKNLVNNALKYHVENEFPVVRITSGLVRSENYAGSGSNACDICVYDKGIGIDPRYSEKIFEAFQRLHGQSEFKGTGMGLAICKKIVEQHHGEIYLRSTPGEGTCFIVRLPLRQAKS